MNGDSLMAQFLKDEVKDKIKKSAVVVFTEKGFSQSSIKAIAEHAQVSVGNVYRYFHNKEALYSAIIQGVDLGIVEILKTVELSDAYKMPLSSETQSLMIDNPMILFMELYKEEKAVFNMLLQNGRDQHYKMTIDKIVGILKDHFYKLWGSETSEIGLNKIEISALTNAIVFAVIDLLNQTEGQDEEEITVQVTLLVSHIIQGYLLMKQKKGEHK